MKKVFLIFVMSSALTFPGLTTARAQVIDTVVADIPFGFVVHDRTLPAGEYTIKRVISAQPSIMEITSNDGHQKLIFLVVSTQMNKAPHNTELIFDRFGDQYFLSEIFEAWDSSGVELPKSHVERKIEKEGASAELDSVVVPAKM